MLFYKVSYLETMFLLNPQTFSEFKWINSSLESITKKLFPKPLMLLPKAFWAMCNLSETKDTVAEYDLLKALIP